MAKLNIIVPALVFVILVLAFGWIWTCESKKEITQQADVTQWRTAIDGLQTDTAALRTENRELTRRIISDSTAHAKDIWATQTKITQRKAAAVVMQPQIQPLVDSIPVLKEFIALKDSIIHGQDETISQISQAYTVQVKGLNKQLSIHAEIQAKNDEIMRLYEERIAKLMKDFKKSERRRKFNRTMMYVFGAGLGTAIILSQ
jgi:uncharacterized membrane protein